MVDICLVVLTVLVALWVFPIIVLRLKALLVTLKWGNREDKEVKDRYFLYDLKNKKWVETKKEPDHDE